MVVIMRRLILLMLLFLTCCSLHAQRHTESDNDFYKFETNIYNRDYNYEAQYLKHKYESRAESIMTTGYGVSLALGLGVSLLAVFNDWNLWITIPCETIVMMGTILGFVYWSQAVKAKAEKINVTNLCEYRLSDNYCMTICNHYDRISQRQIPGLGLNISF